MPSYLKGPETIRLIHRAFHPDDAEALFALNSHPDVMRYTGEAPLTSISHARDAILQYPDFETVGFGRWACVLKETDKVIGFCGLKFLEDLECVDVGYRFLPEYWGRGLATEACTACVQFGLETLRLKQIVGLVLKENVASVRVLEKCGMSNKGEFPYDGLQVTRFEITR